MKTKKILAMLIAAILLISMLPFSAFSTMALEITDKIKEVELTLPAPVSGDNVYLDYGSVIAKHHMSYKVVGVTWYKDNQPQHLGVDAADKYFIGGHSYTVRVDLQVKGGNSGWNFEYKGENTDYSGIKATINGQEATVTHRELNMDDETVSVLYTFENIPAKNVTPSVTIPAPVAGETYPAADKLTVGNSRSMWIPSSDYHWYVYDGKTQGNWRLMDIGETFVAGKDYRVKLSIQTLEGFRYDVENAHPIGDSERYVFGYVNGRQTSLKLTKVAVGDGTYQYYDTNAAVVYDFVSCEAQQLGSVSFSGIQAPAEGQHPQYTAPTMGDATYSPVTDDAVTGGAQYGYVNGIRWGTASEALTADSVFENGKVYSLSFFIKAGDIYRFADWMEASANIGYVSVQTLTEDPTLAFVQIEFAPCDGGVMNEINIGDVRQPATGMTPDYDFTYSQGVYKGEVEGDILWYDMTEGKDLTPTDTFVYGHSYRLRLILRSDKQVNGDAGKFEFAPHASLKVKINGLDVDSVTRYNNDPESHWVAVDLGFECAKAAIDNATVNVTVPVEGATPAQRVDAVSDFYQIQAYMFTGGDSGTVIKPDEVFAGGKNYYFIVCLSAKEGYRFHAGTKATINGQTATLYSRTDDLLMFTTSFIADEQPYFFLGFNPGEGAQGSMTDIKVKAGSTVTLPDCEFTAPDGKQFLAWSTDGTPEGVVPQTITVTEGMSLTALWESPDAHTHVYGKEFNGFDEFGHYKLCISPNCPQLGSYETKSSAPGDDMGHNWGNNTNCDTTCVDCGYERTVNQAGEPLHFYEHACSEFCPNCGQTREVTHTPGAAATCTEDQTCTVCKKILTMAEGHKPGDEATCGKDQTCVACHAVLTPATGAHTPGDNATCTTPQICTTCNAELQPATGHSAGVEWITDENGHHKLCGCGEQVEAGEHTDSDGDKKCDTCGYSMSSVNGGAAVGIVAGAAGGIIIAVAVAVAVVILVAAVVVVVIVVTKKKKQGKMLKAATDAVTEDAPAQDTPAEDAPVEDTPAEDAPVEDAPAQDTPAEDAPVEDQADEDQPQE